MSETNPTYHKIPNVFKRRKEKPNTIILGDWFTDELEALADVPIWYAQEKIDGMNIRIKWDGNRVSFGGKTDNAQIPPRLNDRLEYLFGGEANEGVFEELFAETPVTIYGEGFGSKIQSGGDYFPESVEGQNEFAAFDIKIGDNFLRSEDVSEICRTLGCSRIQSSFRGSTLGELADMVLADALNPPKSVFGNVKSIEGYVARTLPELKDRTGKRIMCKLKYADFEKAILNKESE